MSRVEGIDRRIPQCVVKVRDGIFVPPLEFIVPLHVGHGLPSRPPISSECGQIHRPLPSSAGASAVHAQVVPPQAGQARLQIVDGSGDVGLTHPPIPFGLPGLGGEGTDLVQVVDLVVAGGLGHRGAAGSASAAPPLLIGYGDSFFSPQLGGRQCGGRVGDGHRLVGHEGGGRSDNVSQGLVVVIDVTAAVFPVLGGGRGLRAGRLLRPPGGLARLGRRGWRRPPTFAVVVVVVRQEIVLALFLGGDVFVAVAVSSPAAASGTPRISSLLLLLVVGGVVRQ
mmetsp:Transcript_23156/g.68340  ORF Transcript_23156/g.68340 Transcript_23156/m.68340 type:complete len:281 (+) Transcript_23156:559-1401(+)